ncbi:MAG: hypothetical protein ABI372_09750 [Ginsengibacter sp.]
MNQSLLKNFIPVIIFFLLVNVLVFLLRNTLAESGFNIGFLLTANVVLFLLSCFGFFIQSRGVKSTNIHAFIRGVYSSLLLKMFVIVLAIVVYILIIGGHVNKPSLFTSMGIYLVYTSLEVIQLMKISRKKSDA